MNEQENRRRKALLRIYTLFDIWVKDFQFACEKGCATCCTRSVMMTSLEGHLIHDYIKTNPELLPLMDQLPADSPTPADTTNRFALSCLRGEATEEESLSWDLRPCIFLREKCCIIYPVRSFMCRSFGSRVRCSESGSAEIDPIFLTLNTIIMQCIEHLDQGRPWGNMNTILRRLKETGSNGAKSPTRLPRAEPLPGFLIPPEEEKRLRTQLNILQKIIRER